MSVTGNIGQYRIIRKIGAGGMGTVYLAEHILLGRKAAIKTLLPAVAIHPEIVDRFFNEARATSVITDPGVVQVFDFGYHVDGTAYIVMEYLEGEALSARLDRLRVLDIGDALRITRQVAGALGSAHERGIIHRDLKPENVFLIRDSETHGGERAKILDFGICKIEDADLVHTQTGTTLGTPAYMSPEQCRGTGGIDQRSDIYALGCVLFQMLTGRAPFECEGSGEFIVAHLQEPAPAPSTFRPELPPGLDEILLRCLAKSPAERFQTMGELQVAIEAILGELAPTPKASVTGPKAVPLGEGFKSVYDGNFMKRPATDEPLRAPTTLGTASGEADFIPLRPSRLRAVVATLSILGLVALIGGLMVMTSRASAEDDHAPTTTTAATTASTATPEGAAAPIETVPATTPPAAAATETAPTEAAPATAPAAAVQIATAPAAAAQLATAPAAAPIETAPAATTDIAAPRPAAPVAITAALPRITEAKTQKASRPAVKRPAPRRKAPARQAAPISASTPSPGPVTAPAPAPAPAPTTTEDLYDTR